MRLIEPVQRIDAKALGEIVDDFLNSDRRKQFIENLEYFKGQNPMILTRKAPEIDGPDNRIPVSYGRRIINLVTGYMFKPGLVQYTSEDETYLEELMAVFDANNEPIKTEQLGKQTSIQGVGYEYHYVEGDVQGDSVKAVPKFAKLPATDVITLYDFGVEPKLWAFVWYQTRNDMEIATAYYKDGWERFARKKDSSDLFIRVEDGVHFYGDVPLVVYQNNEEMIGDFEPVQHLIDAYDVLVSDSMNEFDRFAWAYLVLKGMSLSDEQAAKLKRTRTFENLATEDQIEFLTKEMATEFIKFMTDLIREEIHRQSGIPNLEDYDAAGASGKTMSKFIYLMELFTDPKESYFTQGLYRRIELIDRILRFGVEPGRVSIIMNRNMPDNSIEQAQIFQTYAGFVSQHTLLENFADFVDDPDAEMERLAEERDAIGVDVDAAMPTDGNTPVDSMGQVEAVQDTALNGAQVSALLEIVQSVATGILSVETARPLIRASFPGIAEADITAMFAKIKKVTPRDTQEPVRTNPGN